MKTTHFKVIVAKILIRFLCSSFTLPLFLSLSRPLSRFLFLLLPLSQQLCATFSLTDFFLHISVSLAQLNILPSSVPFSLHLKTYSFALSLRFSFLLSLLSFLSFPHSHFHLFLSLSISISSQKVSCNVVPNPRDDFLRDFFAIRNLISNLDLA